MACCSSTKISTAMYAGLNIDGKKVCHPFVTASDCYVQDVKFWLQKHPSDPTLPSEVRVSLQVTNSDGKPLGDAGTEVVVAVPAGLTETGEELTATFAGLVQIYSGQKYGIVYYFPYEGSAYSIMIGGGEDDTCPWETGGDTIPVIEAEYPGYAWAVQAGPCYPSYYSLGFYTGSIQVTTLAATGLDKTVATLNGEIVVIPSGYVVTRRGFQWGTTEDLGTEWSETGSFSVGTFSHEITGLSPGVTYYFRAFACITEETTSLRCYAYDTSLNIYKLQNWTPVSPRSTPPDSVYSDNPAGGGALGSGQMAYQRYEGDSPTREYWLVKRAAGKFDTTGIPTNATITKATLHVWVRNYDAYSSGGENYQKGELNLLCIPEIPWDADELIAGYWDDFAGYSSVAATFSDVVDPGAYQEITLNATARDHITKGGWTYFAARLSKDIAKTSLTWPTGGCPLAYMELRNTTYDCWLDVEYVAP